VTDTEDTQDNQDTNQQQTQDTDTITISRTGLWQGVAGLFAVLFLASIVLQGAGIGLNTNTGSPAAPSQGTGDGGPTEAPSQPSGQQTSDVPASVGDDPVLGQEDAPVTLVKFTDFGCPFCQRWSDNTKPQLVSEYVESGDLKIVYKDSPIPQLHPGAEQAHVAANCVYDQAGADAYYDYTDELYGIQNQFASRTGQSATDALVSTASDLGYDISSCVENNTYDDEISEDKTEAENAALRGTPHFVVKASAADTGTPVRGAQPFSQFQQLIESQLS
jgi:protein-disulfide isomerase